MRAPVRSPVMALSCHWLLNIRGLLVMSRVVMARVVIARIVMAGIMIACIVMTRIVMAGIMMTRAVMAGVVKDIVIILGNTPSRMTRRFSRCNCLSQFSHLI